MPRRKNRPKRARIQSEPANGVHEGQAVGPCRLRGACDLGDVRHRRRELRPERLARREPCCGDDLGSALGGGFDVWTRHVQLDCADDLVIVEAGTDLGVVVDLEAADRDPHGHAELFEPRQVPGDEPVDARVREADRVEHADVGLGNPDRGVALTWQWRHRLGHEGVEAARHIGRSQRVEAAGGVKQHREPALRCRGA